jgi:hypothetical protein
MSEEVLPSGMSNRVGEKKGFTLAPLLIKAAHDKPLEISLGVVWGSGASP